jgi:hypothetical protein
VRDAHGVGSGRGHEDLAVALHDFALAALRADVDAQEEIAHDAAS